MTMRCGYKASAEQFGPRELLDFGVAAEAKGFDSVVVSDHFQPWKHTGGHAPFSFAWLGALGERTARITLGTSVVAPGPDQMRFLELFGAQVVPRLRARLG